VFTSLWSYLPAVGLPLPVLGILAVSYLCAMSMPWLIAAMIATLSRDQQRAKQARQALRAMRRNRPPWWPSRPKSKQ
jgi:hypothetical protein